MNTSSTFISNQGRSNSIYSQPWDSFDEILQRLHREGIYLHSEQLAEFFLAHGLPVDLNYVPSHLQDKAHVVNANYQGAMARLENRPSQRIEYDF